MKKIIFCLSIFAGMNMFAQQTTSFSIGPTVGASHSVLMPYNNWEFNPQWTAGLSWIYGPMQHFAIGGDVRYSLEGGKFKSGSETGSSVIRMDYLRVPVKAMYFFGTYEQDFRPKITLGPSVGFLVDEKNTEPAPANKVDFGLNGSVGFNYRMMENLWLNVDANYYQGLLKVRDATSLSEHNANIGLQLGVLVGL
ncbi:MAG: hypothetical protein K0S33_2793 [Bacteroidetes bacterium]|jgi:hypothetical protein|nr:hypothetical protein [Bacteroidota bacterium]